MPCCVSLKQIQIVFLRHNNLYKQILKGQMKKFWVYFLIFWGGNVFFGQINDSKKIIDSLTANSWRKSLPDIDSITEASLVGIKINVKDTIILKSTKVLPELGYEVPITPFQLIKQKEDKSWFFFGQNSLVFNQASFSNWNSGGNNNIGSIAKVNYNISFKKRKHFLENNFQLGYGFVANKGQTTRKTEDYINVMSNYGYDIGRNYYLSVGLQFVSQFAPGFDFTKTPSPNYDDRISKFLAPAFVNLGVGISYNPNENFQVIVRPLNGKFTIVSDPLLQKKGMFGLEKDGESLRKELGTMVNFLYRIKIYKDISLVNKLNFFTNYLSHTERVDIAYSGTLNLRLNKLISTTITGDVLYDHDQIAKLQAKQTLGIGFIYNIGVEEKPKPKKLIKPFAN